MSALVLFGDWGNFNQLWNKFTQRAKRFVMRHTGIVIFEFTFPWSAHYCAYTVSRNTPRHYKAEFGLLRLWRKNCWVLSMPTCDNVYQPSKHTEYKENGSIHWKRQSFGIFHCISRSIHSRFQRCSAERRPLFCLSHWKYNSFHFSFYDAARQYGGKFYSWLLNRKQLTKDRSHSAP